MSDRLDRIEAILERLVERQDRFQDQLEGSRQQAHSAVRDTAEDLVSMMGRVAQEIENLTAVQRNTQLQIDALAAAVTAYISQTTASGSAEF